MLRLFLLALLTLPLVAAGCANERPTAGPTPAEVPHPFDGDEEGVDPSKVVSGVGRIVYMDLEGGFYGLVADDGTRYNPLDLDEQFKQDGLRVRFRALKRTDVVTIRMWGKNVEILDMLPIEVKQD